MSALLGGGTYTASQASYDLTRLRCKGLIERLPGRNVYHLTPDGQRFAVFYTKLHNRLLRPLMAADAPPAPLELRHARHGRHGLVAGEHGRPVHVPIEVLNGIAKQVSGLLWKPEKAKKRKKKRSKREGDDGAAGTPVRV